MAELQERPRGEIPDYWLFITDREMLQYHGLFKDCCYEFAKTHQISTLIAVIRNSRRVE
jgi:hypothetical protein